MKNERLKSFLAQKRLPLLIGLTAGMLAFTLLQDERAKWRAQAGEGAKRVVLTVGRDVKAGVPLDGSTLKKVAIPAAYVHPLSVSPDDREIVSGVAAAHNLKAGQPLLWSDVADPSKNTSEMAALVRPNERAISLRVNEVSSVGRLIRNNDHIDIFGTFNRPSGEIVTVPVLQNVTVVATGQSLHGGTGDYATISVSVSPQEAALLTLAQETGRLTYVLRNSHDFEASPDLHQVSLSDLFADEKRQAVQKNRNIRVLRGKL